MPLPTFVSAFLNSENTFEIYMEQPPGFDEEGNKVWLLLETLYMSRTELWRTEE